MSDIDKLTSALSQIGAHFELEYDSVNNNEPDPDVGYTTIRVLGGASDRDFSFLFNNGKFEYTQ